MKSHSSCHGCDLCLLGCPVWHATHDVRLTPHGRAKALQRGATPADLRDSIASCTLCGACEPMCPEEIPLVDLVLELRRQQPLKEMGTDPVSTETGSVPVSGTVLLAGAALRADASRLRRVAGLLDASVAEDDGNDISAALECGVALDPDRRSAFVNSIQRAGAVVVADGLLLRKLREWLPGKRFRALGEALSEVDAVRSRLRATDLYVIESRAFHLDHQKSVRYYDTLAKSKSLSTNLDLQRLAVPTTASSLSRRIDPLDQARWILEGRSYERVVVEDAADCAVFAAVTDRPVLHLGDL